MAVWSVFLPAAGLHRYLLHADDLRNAEEKKRGPNRPQRPPKTGEEAFLQPFLTNQSFVKSLIWVWTMFFCVCVSFVCSAKRGGQDGVLPGSGFRSVLAASPSQSHPQAHHLWRARSKPLWTAQVYLWTSIGLYKFKNLESKRVTSFRWTLFQFLPGAGLHRDQHGVGELLHKPYCPLHGQQAF